MLNEHEKSGIDSIRPTVEDIEVTQQPVNPSRSKIRLTLLALMASAGISIGAVKSFSSSDEQATQPEINSAVLSVKSGVSDLAKSVGEKIQSQNTQESETDSLKHLLKKSLIEANGNNWSEQDLNNGAFKNNMADVYMAMCPHWIIENAIDGTTKVSDKIFFQALQEVSKEPYQNFSDKPTREQIGKILEKSMPKWIKMQNGNNIISNLLHYHPDVILYLLPAFKENGMDPPHLARLASSAAQANLVAAVELKDRYEENILPGNIGRDIYSMASKNIPIRSRHK